MQENINRICLICQTDNISNYICINSDIGIQLNVEFILNQHFGIEPRNADNDDQFICENCWSITNSFHKLYEQVYQNKTSILFVNVNNEKDSNKNRGDMIKNESILDGYDDNKEDSVIEENYHIDVLKTTSKSKNVSTATRFHFDAKGTDTESISKRITDINKKSKPTNSSKKLKKSTIIKNNQNNVNTSIEILEENKQIKEFFSMACDLCEYKFLNYLEIRMHYTKMHKQVGYLKCCNKKFYRRCLILDHMNRHLNPDAYKCIECNKIFVNKKVLKNHMDHHAPVDQRPFKCDICSSSYTKLFELSQHMRLTHSSPTDKIFQCAECNKSFINKSILTTHIRGVHEFAYAHVCHICAKTFKSKQVYELHQREHMNIELPKVQCHICDKWFKHEHSLRRHMYRHNDGEASCTLCNKIAPNKNALGSHMRDVHRERTHKCTLCSKAFIKARTLKEHMATHTGVDIYTCSYCPTTFKSSANMHSHRKKVHFDDWLLEREKRQKP